MSRRNYARETFIDTADGPFMGNMVRARAMCIDGVVRAVRPSFDGIADSFFSIPATCTIKGKAVSGFITFATERSGLSTEIEGDMTQVEFHANLGRANSYVIDATYEDVRRAEGSNLIYYTVRAFGHDPDRRSVHPGDSAGLYARLAPLLPADEQTTLVRSWQHDGEPNRIHYIRMVGAEEQRRWCEPGHEDWAWCLAHLPVGSTLNPR